MIKTTLTIVLLLLSTSNFIHAQLKLGMAKSNVNFREGPGLNFNISHSINQSNLLVILPREEKNGFIEVFDIESSAHGYVYESYILVSDTLKNQKQHFFEKSAKNANGDLEIALINRTDLQLFIWINKNSYNLDPREKKTLILENENITYFCSAPGLFPIFGEELLQKGNTYQWDFSI